MIKISYVDVATTLHFSPTSWGTSYIRDADWGDIQAVWYTREPNPIKYRTQEHGRLNYLGTYGDARQRNNAIEHIDIDGTITPAGTASFGGQLMLKASANDPLWAVYQPGTYFMTRWIYSTGNGADRLVIYNTYSDGAVWAVAGYSFYKEDQPRTDRLTIYIHVIYDDHLTTKIRWKRFTEYADVGRYTHARMRTRVESVCAQLMTKYSPSMASTASRYSFTKSFTFTPFRIPERDAAVAMDRLMDALPPVPPSSDAEVQLYKTCLEGQTCFSSNGIAYASDLKKAGDTIRTFLALVGDPLSPKQWAAMWLSMRFGDRLQVQDSKELIRSIRGELGRILNEIPFKETHARASQAYSTSTPLYLNMTVYRRARLRCENDSYNALMTSIKKFMDWDVWPTLENTWDMIPLSFVVDWFLNLSTILSNIDAMVYAQYLRIRIYERSDKAIIALQPDVVASAFGLIPGYANITVSGKRYNRYPASVPRLTWAEGWAPGLPSNENLVDGGSLIVQFI